MREIEIYACYDCKGEEFKWPMFFNNKAQAVRTFQRLARDKETELGQYPLDFSLMFMGKMDMDTGAITPNKAPINMGIAANFIEEEKNEL